MEAIFAKLSGEGKNTVESLLKWFTDLKLINEKFSLDKAKALFGSLTGKDKVELPKFQEVLGKVATEQKMDMGDLQKKLMESQGSSVVEAAKGGLGGLANAFK